MMQIHYDLLAASEKRQNHRRQRSLPPVWRIMRQRQGLIRRLALLLVVILLVYGALFLCADSSELSSVPIAPPSPFILTGTSSSAAKEETTHSLETVLGSIAHLSAPTYRPQCAAISSINSQYTSISAAQTNFTIFLALDLQNAQSVLPTFIHELPVLLSFMGSHRFHVSIVENGSTDYSPGLLVTLASMLAAVGSSYKIEVHGQNVTSHKENGRRIVELARLRNEALESLYNGEAAKEKGIDHFDVVLFMNDIVWCASDMLEILHEHVTQEAHMTCATDWSSEVVYDRWIARTMSGSPFYSQDDLLEYFNGPRSFSPPYPRPLPYDEHERKQFEALRPFQVFSCWNGAAVIDARAFLSCPDTDVGRQPEGNKPADGASQDPLNPASAEGPSPIRFRTALNDASRITEKVSECFLLSVDLWRIGMSKIMLVPRASVAYDLAEYERVRQDGGRTVPHPIGIEPRVTSRITAHLSQPATSLKDLGNGANSRQLSWISTPPPSVIYHDYAWWHETERWGRWDEA